MAPAGQGLGQHLRGCRTGTSRSRAVGSPVAQPGRPPSSLPAWRGTQPSRRMPGHAGRCVGQGSCIRLGFTSHRPRERPHGPSPGEPGPGKSPAAGARCPPGTGHRGSCKGAFIPGQKAGVWGSPALPAPGHSPSLCRVRDPRGTGRAPPPSGSGTPSCRPRKDLRCARKLADFRKTGLGKKTFTGGAGESGLAAGPCRAREGARAAARPLRS